MTSLVALHAPTHEKISVHHVPCDHVVVMSAEEVERAYPLDTQLSDVDATLGKEGIISVSSRKCPECTSSQRNIFEYLELL